jgi:Uma2 family endonuclease
MAQPLPQNMLEEYDLVEVAAAWTEAVNNLVTEDDTPVDSLLVAKQQTLLIRALYSSWTSPANEDHPEEKRTFLADANVGIFYSPYQSPIVPDFFLSLDVELNQNWHVKEHCSYFVWEFEKAPDVVVEIVSNRKGSELSEKLRRYAQIGVTYYVVYDPQRLLSEDVIRVYERSFGKQYRLRKDTHLPEIGLLVTLWEGKFEGHTNTWLRWCDAAGNVIPTGEERAVRAEARVTNEATARQEAEARAAQAEAELARLREELARLKAKDPH